MIRKINHVAILLDSLDDGKPFWAEALGLPIEKEGEASGQDVRIAFLPVGDSHIELLEPTDDSSGVAAYLRKRGPGLHHICLEVDNIEDTLTRLKEANVALIDEDPRTASDGRKFAFIHPKGTGGVLVELYELLEG